MTTRVSDELRQHPPAVKQVPRVGLVLGAGGVPGAAFHAGTLLGLKQDLGWDADRADVVVGSSIGSLVGALIRTRLSADDIAAWAASVRPLSRGITTRRVLDQLDDKTSSIAVPAPLPPIRRVRQAQHLLRGRRQGSIAPHTAAMALMPGGWVDPANKFRTLETLQPTGPSKALWIVAVRIRDAQRVVFGQTGATPDLGLSVAASCAIPGVFRPVKLGSESFIDGGAHSPTNADLLIHAGVDIAVILSPMSAHAGAGKGHLDRWLRAFFTRQLDAETKQLEAAGIEVIVFQPDRTVSRSMGRNPLSRSHSGAVVREAFFAAGEHISRVRAFSRSEWHYIPAA